MAFSFCSYVFPIHLVLINPWFSHLAFASHLEIRIHAINVAFPTRIHINQPLNSQKVAIRLEFWDRRENLCQKTNKQNQNKCKDIKKQRKIFSFPFAFLQFLWRRIRERKWNSRYELKSTYTWKWNRVELKCLGWKISTCDAVAITTKTFSIQRYKTFLFFVSLSFILPVENPFFSLQLHANLAPRYAIYISKFESNERNVTLDLDQTDRKRFLFW